MTTTDTVAWQACRHCSAPVHPDKSGTLWLDTSAWGACPDGNHRHEPDAIDSVIHWTAGADLLVRVGDRVLDDGQFETVSEIHWNPDRDPLAVRVSYEGHGAIRFRDPRGLVAVRRYTAEEAP